MITSVADERIKDVRVTDDELVVALADGRTLSVPLVWYPRLLNASAEQRSDWELIGDGEGVHWPQIDEDLSAAGLLRGIPAPAAHPQSSRAQEIQNPIVQSAREFYGNSIGELKSKLQQDRAELESLAQQILDEEAKAQIHELADSYEAIESSLDQSAEDLGVTDMVNQALQQAQEAVGGAVQQAQDTAGQAARRAHEVTQGAAGQTVERTVDESGNIYDRIRDAHGEVIGEDLVSNVADLPVEEEYIDDEGRVVSRVRDDSGNVFERVFDDQGNVVEVRGTSPSRT